METVFMLSEFPSLKKLTAIEAARAQGRKHGLRMIFVAQDIHQLRDIYGPHGAESFAGQCQAGFTFAPGDWESAEWVSRRLGEENVINVTASESDDRAGVHRSYSIQRQRCWPPEKVLSLPRWHGLVWLQGQSEAVPVYAAPYWETAAKRLARPDPYHSGGKAALPGRKVTAAIAAAIALLIGGAWLSHNDAGAAVWNALRTGRNAALAALNVSLAGVDPPQENPRARVSSHPAKPVARR
jgi:Type IV secretion-system coupling protein DNA-binding domain